MTDLEDLWDDLPVGPAPTAQILREARAQSGPRRSRRPPLRPLSSIAGLAAIGGAFVFGTYVTGPPAGTPGAPPTGDDGAAGAAAFHGELMAAESCDALLDYYVERGLELVGPWGWDAPYYGRNATRDSDRGMLSGLVRETASETYFDAKAVAPTSERAESSGTGTNVQEAAVDEPDVVKTDGERLFRIESSMLSSYDVTGQAVRPLAELDLGELEDAEILLAGDTVVAIGNDGSGPRHTYGYEAIAPMTRVVSVDVSDPESPATIDTVDFDSSLVTARQHGDAIRLITSAGLPELDFVHAGSGPRGGLGERAALERNADLVRATTISDWLPTGSVGGGTDKRLAECEDVALPKDDLGLDTMSVIGFVADDPATWDVTALAASAPLAYASADHLYLGATPAGWSDCWDLCAANGSRDLSEEDWGTTHLFGFDLTPTGTSYVGAGEVDGLVQDRWAMDEHDGTLRLAVSPTERTGNFNSIVTMRRDGDELVEIGRLDKLGVNETIESVRWMDTVAILVTFRQIDPLYTVDLTTPESPTLLGELKIPGFSEYLHPLGPHRLIGIGQGPTGKSGWGAAAALFEVTDLTDPQRLDVVAYDHGTEARAGTEPRQFTWLPEERVALTVISKGWRGRTGWVSVLSLGSGQMTNRMVEAEYGVEIADLRLVPLPDGRVIMSTADDAVFFDL